jgi:hypothetical protein
MKRNLSSLLVTVAGTLVLGVSSTRGSLEVSGSVSIHASADFYAPLSPGGVWVDVGSYGRCWHPAGVAVGWRPYCDGEWVWTDCGWYWQSDEPWAWACYHYGCWAMDPVYGWVWVPGVEWAPAWVSWRVGGGYIGWAPLAPRGAVVVVGGPEFVFVQEGRFQQRVRPSTVVINNTTLISHTTVINNLKQESRTFGGSGAQKVMVNEGPGSALVKKATGKRLAPVSIREAAGRTHVPPAMTAGSKHPNSRETVSPTPVQPPASAAQPKLVPGGRGEPSDSGPAGAGRDAAKPSSPDRFDPPPGHSPGREGPPSAPPGSSGGKHEGHGKD